jgi:hypothetical protein
MDVFVEYRAAVFFFVAGGAGHSLNTIWLLAG